MSNTVKRILSALVLAAIVFTCVYFGRTSTLAFLLITGMIAVDEIFCNFFEKKRFSASYLLTALIYLVPFIYLFYIAKNPAVVGTLVSASVIINLIFVIYLFGVSMESKLLQNISGKFPLVASLFILFPIISLGHLVFFDQWSVLLGGLLFINFGMDTGAWFFGKNFGKHKLWKKVSPNKTIEGLIGGCLTSGAVGVTYWHFAFDKMSIQLFVFFSFLGIMSQVGDLIQSKIKRQYNIKDSSQLIPGHGGVYDRIDSLLFLVPFFVTALKYFTIVR